MGGLHGTYLCIHRLWLGDNRRVGWERSPTTVSSWLKYLVSTALTFHLVCVSWIFFRASSLNSAWAYLTGLFRPAGGRLPVVLLGQQYCSPCWSMSLPGTAMMSNHFATLAGCVPRHGLRPYVGNLHVGRRL